MNHRLQNETSPECDYKAPHVPDVYVRTYVAVQLELCGGMGPAPRLSPGDSRSPALAFIGPNNRDAEANGHVSSVSC